MSTSPPSRVKRFVAVAVFATLLVLGLFFLVFFIFPDTTPPTRFEYFCTIVWAVASWPLAVVWYGSKEDPSIAVIILLTIASGLFWAFIFELLLTIKRRVWPKKSLQPLPISNRDSSGSSRRCYVSIPRSELEAHEQSSSKVLFGRLSQRLMTDVPNARLSLV